MKRKLSLLLVLVLCIGLLGYSPARYAYAEANGAVEISSEADLELIRQNPEADYILTDDIAMNGDFDPIDSFSGVLNGNGHVISNMTITSDDDDIRVAFINQNTGCIKNLGFENAKIVGQKTDSTYWASVIVSSNNGTISGCFVENSTVTEGYRSAGICVQNKNIIENCYAEVKVTAYAEAGGLVAVNETGATVNMSYAGGDIYSDTQNTGGVSAYNQTGSTVSNCAFVEGSIQNGKNLSGGRIAGKMKGNPTLTNNIADASIAKFGDPETENYEVLNGSDFETSYFELAGIYSGQLDFDFSTVWYFDMTDCRPRLRPFADSNYTDTYEIYTESDLELLRSHGDKLSTRFVLMNDILMTEAFTPIENFNATLDGNGHKISGFEFVAGVSQVSAFIITNNGTIKNLGFASTVVHGERRADSEKYYSYASGLVGSNNGVIEKCYVTGNVSGAHRAGGIAGDNNNLIVDCYFIGYVSAREEAGGICALAASKSGTKNCYVQAAIGSEGKNTGGIAAYAYGGTYINDCVTLSGHIDNGGTNIARIVGRLKDTPSLNNNYASENALVQTLPISSDNADSKEGKTVLNEDTDRSLFADDLGWNLTSVWNYDETVGIRRPVLWGIDEELGEKFIMSIDSEVTGTVADGITYKVIGFTDANFNKQSMSIIKLDYADYPQYEVCVGTKNDVQPPTEENGDYIKYADEEGHDTIKGVIPEQMLTTSEVRNLTVYAGINGEFYTEQGPEGYMIKDGGSVVNGTRISSDEKQYPFHGYLGVKDTTETTEMFVIGTYDEDWEGNYQYLYQASGGQYILTKNGEIPYYGDLIECLTDQPNYDQETYYRYKGRHPRTAVGYNDECFYMVVVDGRQDHATGVFIEELALIMKYLGCTESINMDGGGSSTSVIYDNESGNYDVLNSPSNTATKGVEYNGQYLRSVFSSLLIVDRENNENPSSENPSSEDPSSEDPASEDIPSGGSGSYYVIPIVMPASGNSEPATDSSDSDAEEEIIESVSPESNPVPEGDAGNSKTNSTIRVKQKVDSVTLRWNKEEKADGYIVYGGYSANGEISKIKNISSKDTLSFKVKKMDGEKLKTDKDFVFIVVAYKLVDGVKKVIAESSPMFVSSDVSKTSSNVKNVAVEKSAYTLKAGKKAKINATVKTDGTGTSILRYFTDSPEVATVSKKGKITAQGKGSCNIWVYAPNGYSAKISVTVK